MKLKSIANNQTEITFNDGTVVFFSYDTPVAAYDAVSGKYIRTDCPPVSTHTNKWLETEAIGLSTPNAENVDQSVLDRIVDQGHGFSAINAHHYAYCRRHITDESLHPLFQNQLSEDYHADANK